MKVAITVTVEVMDEDVETYSLAFLEKHFKNLVENSYLDVSIILIDVDAEEVSG